MKHTEYGIHIALSKYPLGNEKQYIHNLKDFYSSYRTTIVDFLNIPKKLTAEQAIEFENLYKPSVFHLFSHFDVAFISLIDNFKFPQRVFEPRNAADEKIKSVSYQILSGSVYSTSEPDNNPFFIFDEKPEFLKIIQIKINNGLLIGNGAHLFEVCVELIEKELKKTGIDRYVFVNGYNWGEITVLCFDESADDLAKCLMRIRTLNTENIPEEQRDQIKNNSLYNYWGEKDIHYSHLFCETLSYLGVNFDLFDDVKKSTSFKSQIEWQIKPGHFPFFAKEMENSALAVKADYSNVYYKDGKTDYVILDEDDTVNSNKKIFDTLRNDSPKILSHIRKVKTKPLFKLDSEIADELKAISCTELNGSNTTENELCNYRIIDNGEVADALRKLNVSRNTRKKVDKIIYNYNLGIQDPVLFIYFIDLYKLLNVFVNKLKLLAEETVNCLKSGKFSESFVKMVKKLDANSHFSLPTTIIQKELIDVYVDVFQEALDDRILNTYNYEDINEFSLDVNSALTNVVSSLDSIIKFYGLCFRDDDGDSIITTINENETSSNKLSVNYNIEHITNVPLIFTTLIKEILNVPKNEHDVQNNLIFAQVFEEFGSVFENKSQEECKALNEILENLNLSYFEIDIKKYYLTFLEDDDLFIFWHWAYAIQSTHLYNSVGYFDERYFIRELFRIVLILLVEKPARIDDLSCPIPELRSYWDKYYNRIVELAGELVRKDSFVTWSKGLRAQTFKAIDDIGNDKSGGSEVKSYNDIKQYFKKLSENSKTLSSYDLDKFYDEIIIQIDRELEKEKVFLKSRYFRILTQISYYNLSLVMNKCSSKFNILRRDYQTGKPIPHFLKEDKKWYLDPFGGFFINDYDERKSAMRANNKMLYLIWHLGTIRKKYDFLKNTKR